MLRNITTRLVPLFGAAVLAFGGEVKAQTTAEQKLAADTAATGRIDSLPVPVMEQDALDFFKRQGLEPLPTIVMPGKAIYFLDAADARKVDGSITMVLMQPAPTPEEKEIYGDTSILIPLEIDLTATDERTAIEKTIKGTCSLAFFRADGTGRLSMSNLIGHSLVTQWADLENSRYYTQRLVSFEDKHYKAVFRNEGDHVKLMEYKILSAEKTKKRDGRSPVFPGQ